MVNKKAVAKFEPIGYEISLKSAIVQATLALDAAGVLALESRDVDGLVAVGKAYIALSEKLCGPPKETEVTEASSETELSKYAAPVGFTRVEK